MTTIKSGKTNLNAAMTNIHSAHSAQGNSTDWYKDAIIYEVHVRAFLDSTGDGIGDFGGLIQKLPYLQDLGVTAIWLLPFYPSPLLDDGYDIADYRNVHPAYGTLDDFKAFLDEAHGRGLKVITELVLNHTSSQHPWFQRARRAAPGTLERDFYVWSNTPNRFTEARIIFKDYETSNWTWDPTAGAYYWHRFYSHQPDLNYDSPHVRMAMLEVVDFWLSLGVDGLRLDAVPYLYEREGTTGENLQATHAFLKELRSHVDEHFSGRMLLAEANQWPEEAVSYFGQGDECHMAFHFPLMPRLFMAIRREDRFPIVDIMAQTPDIPDNAQWALFLRNHDELTLEMVTDEERIYMYRVYAETPDARINLGIRRRLAPLLHNDRRRLELMNALLFSLPGTPVLYYGDEIAMGDNIYLGDRNGVRTPMQWSADRNAGFSRANPQRLYLPLIVDHEYHHESVHVEAQQANPHSFLQWMRRLIALRKRYRAFGRGSIEFLHPENRKVLTFIRTLGDERLLVVANLSRFVQHVELDLSRFEGMVPVELFGRVNFPAIGKLPYFLTLGPHSFYWFSLEPQENGHRERPARRQIPLITVADGWESLIVGKSRDALAEVLLDYLCACRWFHGFHHTMLSTGIQEALPIQVGTRRVYMNLVQVYYAHHDMETYALPLAFATGRQARQLLDTSPQGVVARVGKYRVPTRDIEGEVGTSPEDGVLFDAMWDEEFVRYLAGLIARGWRVEGPAGNLRGITLLAPSGPDAEELASKSIGHGRPLIVEGDLNNTSVVFNDELILKFFRAVDYGYHPEVEIGGYLTRQGFEQIAPLVGWVEYGRVPGYPTTLATLEPFVPNQGSAWDLAQRSLGEYFQRASKVKEAPQPGKLDTETLLELAEREPTASARRMIGDFLEVANLLGQRTAELHSALASNNEQVSFRPVPFTSYYRRSLYQEVRRQAGEAMYTLRQRLDELPQELLSLATEILNAEAVLFERLESVLRHKIRAVAARYHGDYNLSQVLAANGDFVIVDFEGQPHRLLAERRLKHSPLRDVARMLISIDYAARFAMSQAGGERQRNPGQPGLSGWANYWVQQTSSRFLRGYLTTAENGTFVPQERRDLLILLDTLLLNELLSELEQALLTRPQRLPAVMTRIHQVFIGSATRLAAEG
jgi:maltose alpha-D-glucosyltransferase/alpha-amylase